MLRIAIYVMLSVILTIESRFRPDE
jgi:hypothetical protein